MTWPEKKGLEKPFPPQSLRVENSLALRVRAALR